MNLLSLKVLIFSPLLVPLFFLLPIFSGREVFVRRFAKVFAFLHFIYTVCFWLFFEPNYSYFTDEILFFNKIWIPDLGVKCSFAMDGLSLVMVVLTSFLCLLAVITSKNHIRKKHKLYYGLIFLLQTAILGVFTASDLFLFFFFWELELIPMYFLIAQWGHDNAKKSAMKFLLYTFFGSLFMLVGILLLHYYNYMLNSQLTSMINGINISDKLPIEIQILISILLCIGFLVKVPLVPLHTWLPDAHTDATTPVSMLLAGILLKMGAYGLIRFNIELLPVAFLKIAPILMILALINIIYAAFVAYNQTDLKKIVAYSSISNMGIVLLGICSFNVMGISGGIFHMLSHGLISAGLFMIVGVIYLRTKTRNIKLLGGLGAAMPNLMAFSIVLTLAAVGVPLLMGFVGEFMSFYGAFNTPLETAVPLQILVVLGLLLLVLSICYMLKFLHKSFFGNILENWNNVRDISTHEFLVLASIVSVIVFLGVYPMPVIDVVKSFVFNMLESVGL